MMTSQIGISADARVVHFINQNEEGWCKVCSSLTTANQAKSKVETNIAVMAALMQQFDTRVSQTKCFNQKDYYIFNPYQVNKNFTKSLTLSHVRKFVKLVISKFIKAKCVERCNLRFWTFKRYNIISMSVIAVNSYGLRLKLKRSALLLVELLLVFFFWVHMYVA